MRKIRNPKLEIRNKFEMWEVRKWDEVRSCGFGHCTSFQIVSDFEFRISDFLREEVGESRREIGELEAEAVVEGSGGEDAFAVEKFVGESAERGAEGEGGDAE